MTSKMLLHLLLVLTVAFLQVDCSSLDDGLLLVTVGTEETDGFKQYVRSTKQYDLDFKNFGQGKEWKGGDMLNAGGGYKIHLLREGLAQYKDRKDLILMFTDSYDVVVTAGASEILEKFYKSGANVLFSAEGYCWPDKELTNDYPVVKIHEKRFLCSGGFIGYAKDIYEIVTHNEVAATADDQLYYTRIFLDTTLRKRWNMKLDIRSEIFMNLHGALGCNHNYLRPVVDEDDNEDEDDIVQNNDIDDFMNAREIMLKFKGSHSYLYNVKTGTIPVVVHGNGPIKPEFNRLANYLADGWTTVSGCQSCKEDLVSLEGLKDEDFPHVLMGLFIEHATPFIPEFLEKIAALDYPKKRVDVFIHNAVEFHQKDLGVFLEQYGTQYKSVNIINPTDIMKESTARNWALEECMKRNCQYFFSVDGDNHLDDPKVLQDLIEQNRSVLAPMMVRPGFLWSNFWGALSDNGFYARSEDYMDIVENKRIGVWNVPYMGGTYLAQGHLMEKIQGAYTHGTFDPDMAFCDTLREKGIFMMVSNRVDWGHLINADDYTTSHVHGELFEIFNNKEDWEDRYIHQDYHTSLEEDAVIAQPCPDVYWFPIVTETFADHLVEEMEANGGWSGGKHDDPRLSTGYENVPTDDIHMTQIGMEKHWLHFLDKYVAPLTTKVFTGYYSNPPRALLNFVVKYNPSRQRSLRPHHDSSTFTINIALNTPRVDFEGGGCRFLRYNCSVTDTKKGWMLMHPGRLTHYHEGLLVTKGTRYIMVSFVDP